MIDYNKYVHQQIQNISPAQASTPLRARCKKKIKLTKDNKTFLKVIGLLK